MAFSLYKIIKGLLIKEENTNTPKEIEIIPGGTASTKTTITSSQTTNKTITLPDATDTLVGKATTDTLTNKTFDADGTGNVLSNIDDGNIKALAGIDATKIADGSVTSTEFQYIGGLTSDAQTQINSKADSSTLTAHTGASSGVHGVTGSVVGTSDTQSLTNKTIDADLNTLSNIDNADIKVGAAIDAAKIHDGSVSNTEFGYLDGVTSSIQTQLNAKATLTGTETFQNKTLDNTNTITILDSNLTIQDNSDNTKQLKFEASSIATGTTRTLTVPNANTTIVGTDATQTLSNKTFSDAPILSEIATPSTPSSGFGKVYFKSDGFLYQLNDSGIESKVGGSGGGTKNYLTDIVTTGSASPNPGNGNFELGTTTGWSLFNTTLTNKIPTGSITAGASSLTFGVTSTAPNVLAGTYSLNVTASSSWSAGQGVISDAFYIDQEDYAKVLSFKIAYKNFFSAGNADFSGTSDNTLAVYIYDVTNSQWIQPSGVYGITQSSGVGYVSGSFQTSSNGTQYRIAVLAANASSGSGGMYVDDFTIGPNSLVYGAPVSDSQSYSPTGSWENTTYNGKYWRTGDKFNAQINLTFSAAPTTTDFTMTPAQLFNGLGISLDTAKLGSGIVSIGTWAARDTGAAEYSGSLYLYAGTTIYMGDIDGTGNITKTNPFTIASGDFYDLQIHNLPILGWSSSVQMSDSTDTRVVAAGYSTLSSTSYTSPNAIVHTTKLYDTHNAYNTSTGEYTAPVPGIYKITIGRTYTGSGTINYGIYKNGSISLTAVIQAGSVARVNGSASIQVNAGDKLTVVGDTSVTFGDTGGYIFFERLSGPSAIAATETIALYASRTSSLSLTSGTPADLIFDSSNSSSRKEGDTHSAYNTSTGVYTIPAAGWYNIQVSAAFVVASGTQTSQLDVTDTSNNPITRLGSYTGSTTSNTLCGGKTLKFNAGDSFKIRATLIGTTPSVFGDGTNGTTTLSITRTK